MVIKTNEKIHSKKNVSSRSADNYIGMFFWIISIPYMDLIFHIFVYKKIDSNIVIPMFMAAIIGGIISVILSLIPVKARKIVSYIINLYLFIIFVVQYMYYNIFKTFFSLTSLGGAKNATDFGSVLAVALFRNLVKIMLFAIPGILYWGCIRKREETRRNKRRCIYNVAIIAALGIGMFVILEDGTAQRYSPKQLLFGDYVMELSVQRLGVCVNAAKDIQALISGDKGKNIKYSISDTQFIDYKPKKDKKGIIREPQIDDSINFKSICDNTDNSDIRLVSGMIADMQPSYTNEYTGMFKDYNIVFVTAESLCKYAISKDITPTLYKIFNEGFVFTNFYNPLWYHSTVDGEYVNCLSQYPSQNEWSLEKSADTYQPYALGNILNKEGYKSFGYHDYNSYFYDRTKTHPNMGYTTFKAVGYGLDIPNHNDDYSDLECMEYAYKDFSQTDRFNMYFMSFSGHMPYDTNKYSIAENREFVKEKLQNQKISDEVIGYISCQKELDKALEYLIDELEKDGKLEKTLFIVAPDHYPYGLTDSQYNELAGKYVSGDKFEKCLSCFGIWCSSMKSPIVVNKLCSSIDILPTVLNLLGTKYDSRLLAGRDIFSEASSLVVFSDQSFITDDVKYNSSEDTIEYLVPQSQLSEDYLDKTIRIVDEKTYLSEMILDTDYYNVIYKNKPK